MKYLSLLLCLFLVCIASLFVGVTQSSSDELDDIQKQINDLTDSLQKSKAATAPLESQLKTLQAQISGIKARIGTIEDDVAQKKKDIQKGYETLKKQEAILARAIQNYYIKSYYDSPLLIFFSSKNAQELTQTLAYQKAATDQDKQIITNLALSIQDLETRKKNLEDEEKRLAVAKANLDEQSAKLDKIVAGAKAYQATLTSQIANLSAKQQDLLAQKLAGLNIPRSASTQAPACVDDRTVDPGFSPRLAFFTYGVPNRTGLNQYGAKGRAEGGQAYDTILRAYYTFDDYKDADTNIQIRVDGYSSYSLEDYVKRIYEMPDSFPPEALKAQAIAARSYALAYTNNGSSSICATQSCQVFQPNEKGGNWNGAVDATKGKVMIQGANPIKAWFSSTHGGYVLSSSEIGWSGTSWTKHATDTTTGSAGSFSDLANNSYDKSSPWFYCDWGARAAYNKTAWLKPDEVADIVNVILLARADSSTKDHLYQTDKPHPYGGEVWSQDRVKSELASRGANPFNTISDISVSADFGAGKIGSVSLSGNAGTQSFGGSEFKDWFNLRAPANIQIVGPLYNIEKR